MDMDTDRMQQGEVGDFVEVNAQRIATGAEITALATTVSSDDEILIIAGDMPRARLRSLNARKR